METLICAKNVWDAREWDIRYTMNIKWYVMDAMVLVIGKRCFFFADALFAIKGYIFLIVTILTNQEILLITAVINVIMLKSSSNNRHRWRCEKSLSQHLVGSRFPYISHQKWIRWFDGSYFLYIYYVYIFEKSWKLR